ncbi:cell division protein ZapA [Novosphingobium sp. SG751A]|uniref:cell division protein ZapA n=1 Tax=Novosphingobium sp. SG751A TaxID=2587000 RepID=UPI001551E4E1|nr:cell division protein ZapA [Novosphingobium sp. SG751A]NOW44244.1 cell division protein ZapA [Novosphingobium sp. SG751A]
MSRVDLMIGGRDYAVACSPGEEDHVRLLGRIIEEKMDALPGTTNQSEVRSMLFAALLLADEVQELRQQADQGAPDTPPADPALAQRLDAVAAKLEQLAASVEGLF